jgi:predicted DsbA family dithiol-disulfide isomerase
MTSRWLLFTQVCIVTALAASSALYVHYLDPADSAFCGLRSGCEAVRRSGVSYFLGSRFVSLPLFGVAAYAVLFSLTLGVSGQSAAARGGGSAAGRPHVPLFLLSGLGAALGLGLFAYQWLALGQFCWLCVIVDGAAVATAVGAFFVARSARAVALPVESPLKPWAALALAALALLAPFGWHSLKPPPAVPAGVLSLYEPDKINVVEFADFQCPHCRSLHATLKPLLAEYGERVNFVRLHHPLPGHDMADPAARAAICADAQGKGEPMADRLFTMALSADNITAAGRELELDGLAFATCLSAESTARTLQDHFARIDEESFKGLPTTYIGSKVLVGARPEATLRDAFERAAQGEGWSLSGGVYLGVLVTIVIALGVAGLRRERARSEPRRAHGEGLSNS